MPTVLGLLGDHCMRSIMVKNKKLKEAKQAFLRRITGNVLYNKDEMQPKDIADFMGIPDLQTMLANVDIRKWFIEGNTDKDMVRAVVESALDRLRKIIETDETGPKMPVTAAAQVNACKIVLEMADFAPPKQKVIEYADKEVGDMDKEALTRYIDQKTKSINKAK